MDTMRRTNLFIILVIFFISWSCFTPTADKLDPEGNITITWDIITWNDNGYYAMVSISNFQLYRHIESPGWELGWIWPKHEVISNMQGAEAKEQGDCSRFKGVVIPHCCKKDPTVVDLLPGAPYNIQYPNCCRGGVISSLVQDPVKSVSSFGMAVGSAGTSKDTVKIPDQFTLGAPGSGYDCEKTRKKQPSRFLSGDNRRVTQALMTWKARCTYSQTESQKPQSCCVSLSSFYSNTIVKCPNCTCGCRDDITLPGSCVSPDSPYLQSAVTNTGKSPSNLVQCTNHMCPIRVHWHIMLSYKEYWRVKVTITNFNYRMNYSRWNLVVQHPNMESVTTVFSFNYAPLVYNNGTSNDTGMLWGLEYYNDLLMNAGPNGNVQTEILLRKNKSMFTFEKGWAFPRVVYFNGDNCVMPPPNEYPFLPNASTRIIVSLLNVLAVLASWVFVVAYVW